MSKIDECESDIDSDYRYEDEEDEDFGLCVRSFSDSSKKCEFFKWENLYPDYLSFISDIADTLSLNNISAFANLFQNKWQPDLVYDKMSSDGGASRKSANSLLNFEEDINQTPDTQMCNICGDEKKLLQLPCSHTICQECLTEYCHHKIKEGKVYLTCFQYKCEYLMNHEKLYSYLTPDDVHKHKRFLIKSYTEHTPDITMCPNPKCDLMVKESSESNIKCGCGTMYCNLCGSESHQPIECHYVSKWLQKEVDDSEDGGWLAVNTKKCPKCDSDIEKNGGCNHMVCKKCSHHFCWRCKGDWNNHGPGTGGYYTCNKYEEDKKKGILPEEEMRALKLKEDVDLYLECYRKYQDSNIRLKECRVLLEERAKQSDTIDSNVLAYSYVSFYLDNLTLLVKSYQTLKWLYVQYFYQKGLIIKEFADKFEKKIQDYYHFMLQPIDNLLQLDFRKGLEDNHRKINIEITYITNLLQNN